MDNSGDPTPKVTLEKAGALLRDALTHPRFDEKGALAFTVPKTSGDGSDPVHKLVTACRNAGTGTLNLADLVELANLVTTVAHGLPDAPSGRAHD